jgi:formylmethanofuran dehydrogenase subunit E
MKCRSCGADIVDGEDYRMVAEWPFCPSCFEGLMKRDGHEEPPAAEHLEASPAVEDSAPESVVRCNICNRELKSEEGKKLGIWVFCPSCYGDMVSMPKLEMVEAEEAPRDETKVEGNDTKTESTEEGVRVVAGAELGFAAFVKCRGCGRRIPKGGGRIVNGNPFCPDCYYAMPPSEETRDLPVHAPPQAATGIREMGRETDETADEAKDRCGCCNHPLRSGLYHEVEGFTLCRACLSTDPDLAVQVARERHRKLLERLRDELNSP